MRYNLQAVNEWEKRATNLIIGIIMHIGMFYLTKTHNHG